MPHDSKRKHRSLQNQFRPNDCGNLSFEAAPHQQTKENDDMDAAEQNDTGQGVEYVRHGSHLVRRKGHGRAPVFGTKDGVTGTLAPGKRFFDYLDSTAVTDIYSYTAMCDALRQALASHGLFSSNGREYSTGHAPLEVHSRVWEFGRGP